MFFCLKRSFVYDLKLHFVQFVPNLYNIHAQRALGHADYADHADFSLHPLYISAKLVVSMRL